MKVNYVRFFIIAGLVFVAGISADSLANECSTEPNAEIAANWFPPLENVWTPIGWKDHLFRFNILYNGTIAAEPGFRMLQKTHVEKYANSAIMLKFVPSKDGSIPDKPTHPYQLSSTIDGGVGNQGWTENPTPVLWTQWPLGNDLALAGAGAVLRQEIFAHIPGAGDIETGIEPLYAWIRLSVPHVDKLRTPELLHFIIQLSSPNIKKSMSKEANLTVHPANSPYPGKLTSETFELAGSSGRRILEEDGKVRLTTLTKSASIELLQPNPNINDFYLKITLPARQGSFVDLLLPMLPADVNEIDKELALGFEAALAESDAYWSAVPKTVAVIDTPEKQINDLIKHSIKLSQIIAEKNPETGEYSLLTGSWNYVHLWATPTSMTAHMLLDPLGYHSVVAKHLEIFKANQGTSIPPGPAYKLHPGYFSSPRSLAAIDWFSDHGAILHEISKHALLTGDEKFTEHWLDAIIAGCDFIVDACKITDYEGVPGILPPAIATDESVAIQAVWNIGWNYKGLTTATRLLKQINHPRAEEFAKAADVFKSKFIPAFRDAAAKMPKWIDSKGQSRPVPPSSVSGDRNILHPARYMPFHIDTGPLVLVWAGLLDADDDLMKTSVEYFREGPNTKLYDPRGNMNQRPILIHEISSCEPCYSWNTYHSWQLKDREHFIEGIYGLLNGAISPQTFAGCEHRHGIYGIVCANAMLIDLIRLSVIDDNIAENELHLLRLVPLAWVKDDYLTKFENMPTEFGPVTIKFKLTEKGKTLDVIFKSSFRHKPKKVILHIPPIDGLSKVKINGKTKKVKPSDTINISKL